MFCLCATRQTPCAQGVHVHMIKGAACGMLAIKLNMDHDTKTCTAEGGVVRMPSCKLLLHRASHRVPCSVQMLTFTLPCTCTVATTRTVGTRIEYVGIELGTRLNTWVCFVYGANIMTLLERVFLAWHRTMFNLANLLRFDGRKHVCTGSPDTRTECCPRRRTQSSSPRAPSRTLLLCE